LRVDQGQEGLRIRSGRRSWALKTHMNRLGACVWFDGGVIGVGVDGIEWIILFLFVCWCFGYCVCGKGRAAGTGPPHPLGVLIGYLIAGKDGLGSTAGCAG